MQDDFFVDAHDHAEPPMNPRSDKVEEVIPEEKTQTFAEELL
jgi:hypothetical protein